MANEFRIKNGLIVSEVSSSAGNVTIADGDITTDATMLVGAVDGQSITIGKASHAYVTVAPHGTAASEKITLLTSAGTAADAIGLSAALGGIKMTTAAAGVVIAGTTPKLTIGDAGAEDTSVVFDGNAQDFYVGLDDTDDKLKIGLGSAVGTTPNMTLYSDARTVEFLGDVVIPDAGNIGSSSDTNAITISSGGVVAVTATTASSSTSTGALTVGGGLGVGEDIYLAGDLRLIDDKKIYFGTGNDAYLEYDEDGTDELRFAGAAVTFEQATSFDGAVTLGNATGDDITITGSIAASIALKDETIDIGTGLIGLNDVHFGSGGIINFDNGDVTLIHSSAKLTINRKTVIPILNNTIEATTAGDGFRVTNDATLSLEEKNYLAKNSSVDTFWTGMAIENNNVLTSCLVTDTSTVGPDELTPICYINLSDTSNLMFHAVEVHGAVQVKVSSGGSANNLLIHHHEKILATYKSIQNIVDWQSLGANWYNGLTSNFQPGEFCAQRWAEGSNLWMVISYINYINHSGNTTTITAHINALQEPVVNVG
jgi:hypothetical protein